MRQKSPGLLQAIDLKRTRSWPWWPVSCAILLAAACLVSGRQFAWSADLLALLTAFSVVEATAAGLQNLSHTRLRIKPLVYWLLLGIAVILAVPIAVHVQHIFWPAGQVPHAAWLLPSVTCGFVLAGILPQEINMETERRAAAALAQERARHDTERRILEARLAALQGQIEPHFLYNTLANTHALVRQDADAAERCLQHLIAYLRAAMPDLRANTTTLGLELQRAQAYLDIMKIRFGARLDFHIDASPQAQTCLIPPLAVMTLVENAIKHGIEPKVEGGLLCIRAVHEHEHAQLTVEVIDDGVGFSTECGDGIGLINLQERLQALFGSEAELSLNPGEDTGVIARFVVPAAKLESAA